MTRRISSKTGRIARAAALTAGCAAALTAGCGAPPPAKPDAPPPPPMQFVEKDAPFIVDWDASQIASLTAAVRNPNGGAVVVSYQRNVVRILPNCHLTGVYVPSGIGMYRGVLQVRRSDSLAPSAGVRTDALQQVSTSANVPGGAIIDYRFVVVGRNHLGQSRTSARLLDLSEKTSDGCRGATHFIRAALSGAFERVVNANGAPALPPGTGAPGTGEPALVPRAGDFTQCLLAGTAANAACSAFLKIELTALLPVQVSLRLVSATLKDPATPDLRLRFHTGNIDVAELPPAAAGPGAPGAVLPPVDITEDVPLSVDVVQVVKGKPEIIASAEITPADVRRAVFQVDVRNLKTGVTTATLQLAASQPGAAP